VKTTWRLFFVAVLLPVAGAAQASTPMATALQSPVSFDEALSAGDVELTSMMEPTPADAQTHAAAEAPSAASAAPAASSTIAGNCGCNSGGCNSCSDTCCDCGDICNSCCGPKWTAYAGAAILQRNDPSGRVHVRDRAIGANAVVRADVFDFDYAGGPDLMLARWFDNGTGIEGRYFGAMQWDAQNTWRTPAQWAIQTAGAPINGNGIGDITANYISRLNSTEINWRGSPNQTVAFLGGFRWVELHENLGVAANLGANAATANWNTDNHLYGGQVGTIVQLLQNRGPFTAQTWFKGGIYGNDADNQFNLDAAGGPHIAGHTQKGQTAFVGDIAISGTYWFNKNVGFRSGYQLLWIDGVALASDQVTASSSITGKGVNTKGDVFYQGALFGLDFLW
jgi:hypothetical protein